jgi:hypothetical protein
VLESVAFEQLHGNEDAAVGFVNFVDGADAEVIQSGDGAGFALEAEERLRVVGGVVGEKFESDVPGEAIV